MGLTASLLLRKVVSMSDGRTCARYWLNGLDPCQVMLRNGYTPDPWQSEILRKRPRRAILCWGRQVGKTRCLSAFALSELFYRPGSLVLISSYNQKKSKEMLLKVMELYKPFADEFALAVDTTEEKRLANGSRVIALTGDDDSPRSYTADVVLLDEAAFTNDGLRASIDACLAVKNGPLVAMSTPPTHPSGWWYGTWTRNETLQPDEAAGPDRGGWFAQQCSDGWYRTMVRSTECPRISPAFLEQARLDNGEENYLREYECQFPDRGRFSSNRPFAPQKVAAIPRVAMEAFGG